MRIDLLSKRLHEANVGKEGRTLFVDSMPSDCKEGVMLKMPLTGHQIDHYIPGFFNTRFSVIVRSPSVDRGKLLCKKVNEVLKMRQSVTLYDDDGSEAMHINFCLPETLPIQFPRLEGNEKEWSINFMISYTIPEI